MTRHPDALLARTWARTLANLPPQLQRALSIAASRPMSLVLRPEGVAP